MEKNDPRVSIIKGTRYVMKVDGWVVRDAIDFNKKFELFDEYLQARRNNNLF